MTAVNLNGATITDGAGNAANLSLTGLTAERPADRHHDADDHRRLPDSPSSGDLDAGKTVTLTLNLSEAVTVSGRHADADAQRRRHRDLYSGSGTSALTFSYTVAAGQNTADLAVTAVNLNGATIARRRRQCRRACR